MTRYVPKEPPQLTPAERFEFETKRFSHRIVQCVMLQSGRIVFLNSLRDPIGIAGSPDEVHELLSSINKSVYDGNYYDPARAEKQATKRKEKQTQTQGAKPASNKLNIKINL